MSKIEELKELLETSRPEVWDRIPDIDLYMDQVISYMTRQHIGFSLDGEETLTSAMINNYIKNGLLPRAKGKRYSREHIGYLSAICLLKQVLSVGETGVLLQNQMQHRDIEDFYRNYTETLDRVYTETAAELASQSDDEELAQAALEMAVSSYAQMIACKKILQEIAPEKEKK